jgi:hypothetical protein
MKTDFNFINYPYGRRHAETARLQPDWNFLIQGKMKVYE